MLELSASVDMLPLPKLAKNRLLGRGIKTIGELLEETEESLMCIRGMKVSTVKAIKLFFKKHGVDTRVGSAMLDATKGILPSTLERILREVNCPIGTDPAMVRAAIKDYHPLVKFVTQTGDEWKILVPKGKETALGSTLQWIQDESRKRCGLPMADVIRRLDQNHEYFTEQGRLETLISDVFDLVWLDPSYSWFWIRDPDTPMLKQTVMLLSLIRNINVADLRSALDRWHRRCLGEPILHTSAALLELCRAHPEHCFVDGETIIASGDLKAVNVINSNPERAILKAYTDYGTSALSFEDIKKKVRHIPGKLLQEALESMAFIRQEGEVFKLMLRDELD